MNKKQWRKLKKRVAALEVALEYKQQRRLEIELAQHESVVEPYWAPDVTAYLEDCEDEVFESWNFSGYL